MKTRLFVGIVLLLVITVALATPAIAQDKKPVCAPADVIKQLATLKSTGDNAKDIAVLLKLDKQIQAQSIACNGMTFTGTAKKIVGPFDIAEGQYRVTATTWDYMFSAKVSYAGDTACVGDSFMADQLFTMAMNGDNIYGAKVVATYEALLNTQTCRMIIEVDAVSTMGSKPWTLTIEPIE